ncbi:hypothetical protein Dda_1972 [Drechslerella dactyloides]|uniref:RING-type domain-containing protein n=1 Tax=Drechslerella dactyloides TaxID=74499 RepID=A0AAD6NLX8_DREDA|nr:hypothetical protein Dda_1972 [Drechslerella dactyloides]
MCPQPDEIPSRQALRQQQPSTIMATRLSATRMLMLHRRATVRPPVPTTTRTTIFTRLSSTGPPDKKPSPHVSYYRVYGRAFARVLLMSLLVYQGLYYGWIYLEHLEVKTTKEEEIRRLEDKIRELQGRTDRLEERRDQKQQKLNRRRRLKSAALGDSRDLPAPSKPKQTPTKAKRKSTCDGLIEHVEREDEGSKPEGEYVTLWRRRVQLVRPPPPFFYRGFSLHQEDIPGLQSHFRAVLPDARDKTAVYVNFKHQKEQFGIGAICFAISLVGRDDTPHFLSGGVVVTTESRALCTFLAESQRNQRVREEFSITWLLLPPNLGSDSPHVTLEFALKRRDSWAIDLKAEKWLPAFLALNFGDSGQQASLAQLERLITAGGPGKGSAIKARDFYSAVYVPDPDRPVPEMIQVSELTTPMFPFQMRTVSWMMEREGVTGEGGVVKPLPVMPSLPSLCIQETVDWDGNKVWVSAPLALTTTNKHEIENLAAACRVQGGILAEEMGLGKTVELISLLSLHRREIPDGEESVIDPYTGVEVRASGSTLIICPPSIIQQWTSELALHAPGLRVLEYKGTRDLVQRVSQRRTGDRGKVSNGQYLDKILQLQQIPNSELVDYLLEYDIVLSSYNVLASELHYAERPPERSMRHQKRYERRSCPLVEISWWRVCLDEAQMIENGVSNAAQVARVIPRVNAWAVTGTPVQKGIEDLFGLLVFLRQAPWCMNTKTWERLCADKERFTGVFRELALRHTKDIVHEEIKLPRQHRTAISLRFSQVEEENYQKLFEQACELIGVHLDGSPLAEEWDPDSEETRSRMREWLVRLRQTCVHPEVGTRNRRALGTSGPLRTVDEVLEAMIQQNLTSAKQDERAMLLVVAARAHATLEARNLPQFAIELLNEYLESLDAAVEDCRKDVETETETLRREAEKLHRKNHRPESPRSRSPSDDADSDDEDADEEDGNGPASELNKRKNRLRDFIEVKHLFHFLIGSAYFNLKDDIPEDDEEQHDERERYSELEDEHYDIAQQLRKELMSEQDAHVNNFIAAIHKRTEMQDFVDIPELWMKDQKGGIESSSIIDDIVMLAEKLNEQAEVLDEWRERLIQILQTPLIDQEEGAEGDELQQSAESQDEGFLYVSLLRAVVSDRSEALTGITSGLAAAEMRTAKERAEGQDDRHKTLFQELSARRDDVKPINVDSDIVTGTSAMPHSMKGLIAKLRRLAHPTRDNATSSSRAKVEAGLVTQTLSKLQPLLAEQEKALKGLEKETKFLAEVFNARVEFYRQLQVISDMVRQFDEKKVLRANHVKDVDELLAKYVAQINSLSTSVARLAAKGRFLQHLQETQGESQRLCIICQDPVALGVLTVCGHQFCMECMDAWFKHHPSCPVCKRKLRNVDLYPVRYHAEDITIEKEVRDTSDPPSSATTNSGNTATPTTSTSANDHEQTKDIQIYTGIDEETFQQIKKIPVNMSFGSKIDMVVKHLLWIRRTSATKSVIFSQWKEVLDVFQNALRLNDIGFASLEDKAGGLHSFKKDPKVEVFLLHARSQSAGLTLVDASNVFLCEPLVNTGLELQAIARVHRIGQRRETGVYLYVIGGTVEEGVYRHATKRRLEMLSARESPKKKRIVGNADPKGKKRARADSYGGQEGEELEMQLEEANSMQLEGAVKMVERGKGGGEVVDNEQLWSCLFQVSRERGAVVDGVVAEQVHREAVASAREAGRGNFVDDSAVGPATISVQGRVRSDSNDIGFSRASKRARME